MTIAVIASPSQAAEWQGKGVFGNADFHWASTPEAFELREADACFDLSFEMDGDRVEKLARWLPAPVFVNAVVPTLKEINQPFIRINGWPGFLGNKLWELAALPDQQVPAAKILMAIGQDFVFVKDVPGLVTARILSMIIYEAGLALREGVSDAASIDRAMKLGTGYPFGPFEWADKIGREEIGSLLKAMGQPDMPDALTKKISAT